ncbi:MAG: prepilin-type N-terminal cleavage/methylation domain-containing protein [Rickettsiales bacterium]|nr:prepilin-type N-terminal cleavage/methylation domain-containing protein [Rickettsiales bacterium]
MASNKDGFTLIELSIVLVITGLLAAGVLIGRDLIRASELRRDIAEIDKLSAAVNTFRVKYGCLPGDCGSVQSFFPEAFAGDGNSRIVNIDDVGGVLTESSGLPHLDREPAYFMDHLARAQMIASTPFDATLPEDAFAIGKGIYPLRSTNVSGVAAQCLYDDLSFSKVGCHYYVLGVSKSEAADALDTLRSPYDGKEARSIDEKIDDGKPLTGIVVGLTSAPFDDQLTIPPIPYGSFTEGRCALDPIGYYSDDTYYNRVSSKKLCALRIKAPF